MSFFRDSVQTFVVRLSIIFISMIGGIVNARWLGPEGIGVLALVLLLQSFAFRFGNLGFGSSCAYFIARGQASSRDVLKVAVGLSVVMSLLSCVILLAVRTESFSPWQSLPPQLFFMGLLTIFPLFVSNLLKRILSGQLKISAMNNSEIVKTAAHLPALILLVVVLEAGIPGAIAAIIFSHSIGMVYLFVCVLAKEASPAESKEKLKRKQLFLEMWRYGRWNYLIMFLNFYLEELPLIILSTFFGKDLVGVFALGRNLKNRFRILPESFSKVLFPYSAASEDAGAARRTNILCRNFVVIGAAMGGLFALIIEPFIVIVYGESFLPTVPVFYTLIPVIILWPISQFLTVHIAALGAPRAVFFYRLSVLPGCALCSYLLIPTYGAVGTGLSMSATYLMLAGVCIYAYRSATGSSVAEILIPQKSDLVFYRKIASKIPLGRRS